jgi:uncharacterized DUF497 family protein
MLDDVVYNDRFIWNRHKNASNIRKHHVDFETASKVFDDPFLFEVYDDVNSITEERFNVIGSVTGLINDTLLTVSVVYRIDLIRIFSARDAAPDERGAYYEQFQQFTGRENEN